jgi:hypothetical protein
MKIRVAGNTFRRKLTIPDGFSGPAWKLGDLFLVTIFAFDREVSSLKLVGRIFLVVETQKPSVKPLRGMALITILGELP